MTATDVVSLFEAKFTSRTKVLFVSHCTTTNGLVLPLKELAALAHSHGALFVVDGAQGAGGISVDLDGSGVDAYHTQ